MAAMWTLKRCLPALALIAAALLISPAFAQDANSADSPPDGGRGVVRLSIADTSGDNTLLNPSPYPCAGVGCDALESLLVPRLFDVDAATGVLLNADQSDRALVQGITADLPNDVLTLEFDPARTWSDGEPITAYDVLLSLILYYNQADNAYSAGLHSLAGAQVVDDHRLALRVGDTEVPASPLTCDLLPRTNVPIFPAHVLLPTFRAFAAQQPETLWSLDDWWTAMWKANPNIALFQRDVTATSGRYRWWTPQLSQSESQPARFVPTDGTGAALEISRYSSGLDYTQLSTRANELIAGDVNVLLDAPIDERATLRDLADADKRNFQIAEPPGSESLIILLNLANPNRPLPAFHPETGEPLDQGQHPIFGDVRVRRAFQLAIDQQALIDGVLQQSADPLAGLYPPSSWAFDPSLTPVAPDIEQAKHLLDEAGWVEGADGRHCEGCGTTEEGTPLQVNLGSDNDLYGISAQISDQWHQIGARVSVTGDQGSLIGETFDAYLAHVGGNPYDNADPDRSRMLTPQGDTLDLSTGYAYPLRNYTSYNNPEVTRLLTRARTLLSCDSSTRADLYHQVEGILHDDVPFIPVAAPREFYAAAPEVIGFAPRTGDPLWNIESWTVASTDTSAETP